MTNQLRLHGIRHEAVSRRLSVVEDEDTAEEIATAAVRKLSFKAPPKTRAIPEAAWKRRHSMAAATKNTDWCDFYLSASATEANMAGFLSIKDQTVDAEYFCIYIPKAVIHRDLLYKQLLAIYNSMYYWGEQGLIKGKRLLLAVNDPEAAELMKIAKVKGKLGPDKVLILREMNDYCKKNGIETRVPELDLQPEETITHALLNGSDPHFKNQFKSLLANQSKNKGSGFKAKERLFPPIYV